MSSCQQGGPQFLPNQAFETHDLARSSLCNDWESTGGWAILKFGGLVEGSSVRTECEGGLVLF